MRLGINEVAAACGGRLNTPTNIEETRAKINGVSTDSRCVKAFDLFVPIVGPNYDGHDFIEQAIGAGAVCALAEHDVTGGLNGAPLIIVSSTRRALLDLAAYYRNTLNIKIAAVTGSSGKTSAKDMLAAVLSRRYKTAKTERNLNNTIGLPLTVFKIDETAEAAVLEMGMNHFGEIKEMSVAARPDAALITNIGDAHIEYLGSREGVLKAKLEILDGMDDSGLLVVNGDDPLLMGAVREKVYNGRTLACYFRKPLDRFIKTGVELAYAYNLDPLGLNGTRCTMNVRGEPFNVFVPQPGRHMVMNALMAAAAGIEMGAAPEEAAAGIAEFKPSGDRMEVIETGEFTILNDCYNANPASMRAAVDVLAELDAKGGRRVCVLGDMRELGGFTREMHEQLGEYVCQRGIDMLAAIGDSAVYMCDAFRRKGGEGYYFKGKGEFLNERDELLEQGDVILVKASRAMRLEEITAALTGGGAA